VHHLFLTPYLWVQASSLLRLLKLTTFIGDSPELTIPRPPGSRRPGSWPSSHPLTLQWPSTRMRPHCPSSFALHRHQWRTCW